VAGPKKEADQEGRTVVWVDESGFYLLPGLVRTYAPRGRTPILRLPLSRDHLAVISGITPAGRLLMMVRERAYKSPDVVRFLKHLLRHIPGKLLVIWTARRSTAASRSRTSWPRAGPSASAWSGSPATRRS
jgi:DDE superfamily endonuclease